MRLFSIKQVDYNYLLIYLFLIFDINQIRVKTLLVLQGPRKLGPQRDDAGCIACIFC